MYTYYISVCESMEVFTNDTDGNFSGATADSQDHVSIIQEQQTKP